MYLVVVTNKRTRNAYIKFDEKSKLAKLKVSSFKKKKKMIKVKFWSKLLDKEVTKTFDTYEEAEAFARKTKGIIVC